jgi:hypothetical protein
MNSYHSYTGPDAVHIGNGTGLSIAHTGSTILHTSTKPLKLEHVLHVPTMTKNLISVSKLISDNDVIIEFFSNSCLVKDQATSKVFLHGILNNGLYQLVPHQPSNLVFHTSLPSDL